MTTTGTREGTISTDEGLLYYQLSGQGPACIVLSGGPGIDGRYMEDIGGIGDFLTLIQLHPRGSGFSVFPDASDWSLEAYARDVEAVRRDHDLDSVVVLGQSHGGMIAQRYAIDFPRRVRGLVLVDTAANIGEFLGDTEAAVERFRGEPWFQSAFSAMQRELAGDYETSEELGRILAAELYFFFARITPEIEQYLGRLATYPANAAPLKAFNETVAEMDLRPELPAITCPTLVIVGRHDFITNVAMAGDLARLIPNARLEVFEESGHFPFVEERDRFCSIVGDFVDSLPHG